MDAWQIRNMLILYAAIPFMCRLMSLICAPMLPIQFLIWVEAVKVNAGSVMLYVRSVIVYVIAIIIVIIAMSCCVRNLIAAVNFSGSRGSFSVMVGLYHDSGFLKIFFAA